MIRMVAKKLYAADKVSQLAQHDDALETHACQSLQTRDRCGLQYKAKFAALGSQNRRAEF